MKKKTPPYAIIIAALLGLVAIFAAVKWKKNQDDLHDAQLKKMQADMQAQIDALNAAKPAPAAVAPQDSRYVYYATQPVEAGAKISSAFYEKKLTPNAILPDAYTDQSDIVGFYAVRAIEKGDPLTPRNIGKSLPQMSTRISPGMRAVSLLIFNAEANNTGGFAVDGDMVDLLFTTIHHNILYKTEFLMQNVKILYVPGPKIESEQVNGVVQAGPPGDPVSIVFEVTPEQAQALILMSQSKPDEGGRFSMILRAKADKTELKFKPFQAEDYYPDNLKKIQKITDVSSDRVKELAAQIAAEEKAAQDKAAKDNPPAPQGTTNETTTPTPPSP